MIMVFPYHSYLLLLFVGFFNVFLNIVMLVSYFGFLFNCSTVGQVSDLVT